MKKIILFPGILFLTLLFYSLGLTRGYTQIKPQENSMWCWASCIQSALEQANIYQCQSKIVARLTGYPQNRPAHLNEVVQLLQSYHFRAWGVDYPASPEQLYATLASGWKLIAFVNPNNNPRVGHFIILQKISANQLIIVSDPANGQTYMQHPEKLYNSWKWSRSVVVGVPVKNLRNDDDLIWMSSIHKQNQIKRLTHTTMKSSKNVLHAYLSQFGSFKILVWVVALGIIAAYGLLDTEASQQMGYPYLNQGQNAPSMQQEPHQQPLQQPVIQNRLYQPGRQQQQILQIQKPEGYLNRSDNNPSFDTPVNYQNSQAGYNQQKESSNYGN